MTVKYNDALTFKDIMELRAYLKQQKFNDASEENPVHKVFKAADGTFLVWIVETDGLKKQSNDN